MVTFSFAAIILLLHPILFSLSILFPNTAWHLMLLFSSLVDLREGSCSYTNKHIYPYRNMSSHSSLDWRSIKPKFACVGHCHKQPSDQGKQIVVFPRFTVPTFNQLCHKSETGMLCTLQYATHRFTVFSHKQPALIPSCIYLPFILTLLYSVEHSCHKPFPPHAVTKMPWACPRNTTLYWHFLLWGHITPQHILMKLMACSAF